MLSLHKIINLKENSPSHRKTSLISNNPVISLKYIKIKEAVKTYINRSYIKGRDYVII